MQGPNKPLNKGFVKAMLADPEYIPQSPEACECAVPVKARGSLSRGIEWRPCTTFGKFDGQMPDTHVRMGTGDYLYGFLGIRACKKPGEPRESFAPFTHEIRSRRTAQR